MQADKSVLARYARTSFCLFKKQTRLSQLGKQHNQLHVMGGTALDTNIFDINFTASAVNNAGVFIQQRYKHYHLTRLQSKPTSRHNNFRQLHTTICSQTTTPLRGKYPTDTVHEPLCSERARELVYNLKDSEREAIKVALLKYDAERQRAGFEGKLAATQWRTRFGRPSQVPRLGDVDPTGRFCAFPEEWLKQRAAAKAPPPTMSDLRRIFIVNAVPFIAFGFLDNFVMIVAGDSIESVFGAFMCISTMAAAGLGNTVSDILGIGSAYYVERGCEIMGFRLPDLTPIQMEMKSSRHSANLGRIVGITIGCLLGMAPLWFMKKKDQHESAVVNAEADVKALANANANTKPDKS